MGVWRLPRNMQMVQGFPVNRSYTKAETNALISNSSLAKETPTGTVNGTNISFTVTHTPKFIMVDRMISVEGYGYTISGSGPYTISVDPTAPPVQNITSFY